MKKIKTLLAALTLSVSAIAQNSCPAVSFHTLKQESLTGNNVQVSVRFGFTNPTNGNKSIRVQVFQNTNLVLLDCFNAGGQTGILRHDSTYAVVLDKTNGPVYYSIKSYTGGLSCLGSACDVLTSINFNLPILLSEFSAQNTPEGNRLKWATDVEANFSHFSVEKSTDGAKYQEVAQIAGKGAGNYEYTDPNAYGTSYYRLKAVDLDKTFTYSNVRKVSAASNGQIVFTLNGKDHYSKNIFDPNQPANLVVYDLSGRILFSGNINSGQVIFTTPWAPGMYIVQIMQNESAEYIKTIF